MFFPVGSGGIRSGLGTRGCGNWERSSCFLYPEWSERCRVGWSWGFCQGKNGYRVLHTACYIFMLSFPVSVILGGTAFLLPVLSYSSRSRLGCQRPRPFGNVLPLCLLAATSFFPFSLLSVSLFFSLPPVHYLVRCGKSLECYAFY